MLCKQCYINHDLQSQAAEDAELLSVQYKPQTFIFQGHWST